MKTKPNLRKFFFRAFASSLLALTCSTSSASAQTTASSPPLETAKSSSPQNYSSISRYNTVGENMKGAKTEKALAELDLPLMGATPPSDSANWMAALPDNVLLRDINLPGTHDSAAISGYFSTWLWLHPEFIPVPLEARVAREFFDRHDKSITQQLEGGIRLLDVRLQINKNDVGYYFVTCHGDKGSGVGYNEYQYFDDKSLEIRGRSLTQYPALMNEVKTFLTSHPSESIVMILSVDDWTDQGRDSSAKRAAMVALSTRLSDTTSKYEYPFYKDAPSSTNILVTNMPALSSARGKIYLLVQGDNDMPVGKGDMKSGLFIHWDGSATIKSPYINPAAINAGGFMAQNNYNSDYSAKYNLFKDAINEYNKPTNSNNCLINFATSMNGPTSVSINKDFVDNFKNLPSRLGWSLFDFTSNHTSYDCVNLIIQSNYTQCLNSECYSVPYIYNNYIYSLGSGHQIYKSDLNGQEASFNSGARAYSAPSAYNGYLYYQGSNNRLYKNDLNGQGVSSFNSGVRAYSTPCAYKDFLYYQGSDNRLYKNDLNGQEASFNSGAKAYSTPCAYKDFLYYQGSDNQLYKNDLDGNIFPFNTSARVYSTPCGITDSNGKDWIYFQSTNNRLMRIMTDGSNLQGLFCYNIKSSPVASGDYIYYQGTDNKTYRYKIIP
ncbi:MAG: hypothetical protein ACH346_04475 [Chthoniobacterales bacterium]